MPHRTLDPRSDPYVKTSPRKPWSATTAGHGFVVHRKKTGSVEEAESGRSTRDSYDLGVCLTAELRVHLKQLGGYQTLSKQVTEIARTKVTLDVNELPVRTE